MCLSIEFEPRDSCSDKGCVTWLQRAYSLLWLFSNWTVIALFSVPCSITWYNNSKTIKMFFHYSRTGVNSFVGPVLKTSFVVNKGLLMHSFLLWCKLLGLVNSPKSFKLLLHLNGFSMSKMSFCWASVSGKYFWNWDFFSDKKKDLILFHRSLVPKCCICHPKCYPNFISFWLTKPV